MRISERRFLGSQKGVQGGAGGKKTATLGCLAAQRIVDSINVRHHEERSENEAGQIYHNGIHTYIHTHNSHYHRSRPWTPPSHLPCPVLPCSLLTTAAFANRRDRNAPSRVTNQSPSHSHTHSHITTKTTIPTNQKHPQDHSIHSHTESPGPEKRRRRNRI